MNRILLILSLVALVCADLSAQRRGQFRRPDEAAFTKPPLIRWQRNLEDALAIVKATRKPLLLCVNMDGEIACEQLAGLNYRNPAFARLTQGFVPVIASPDRHTPNDYDAQGRRIPCPRFGRVVCSEHIDIEPELYRRYFKGSRNAPRHLALDARGKELFDLFLLNRLADIDNRLKKYGRFVRNSKRLRTVHRLLASREAGDRDRLEEEFATASPLAQETILTGIRNGSVPHSDVLRLALASDSPSIRRYAIEALAKTATPKALPLFDRACDQAEELGGLEALLAALQRMAADDANAHRLARIRKGLYGESPIIDQRAWLAALGERTDVVTAQAAFTDLETLDLLLTTLGKQARQSPLDGDIKLAIAAANLEYGQAQLAAGHAPSFLFQDALQAAILAETHGAHYGLAKGYQARLHYLRGDLESALSAASEALPTLLDFARSKLSAEVLAVFASCRTRALYDAITKESDWPAEWVADIHSAQRVLAQHQHADQDQAAAHIDLLVFLNALNQEGQAIDVAMSRFPYSPDIQECKRRRLLRDHGAQGLIDGYRDIEPRKGMEANHAWFAGYANLVAAEQLITEERSEQAIPAYGSAITLFEQSSDRSSIYADSANHFIALALAGRARLEMSSSALQAAVGDLCAALERRPGSARATDGLGNTPLSTAWLLRSALTGAKDPGLSLKLSAKLSEFGFDLGTENAR